MASGYSGASAPRTTAGITGKGGSKVTPLYKEMLAKVGMPGPTAQISRAEISKMLQSKSPTMAEFEKRVRSNPEKRANLSKKERGNF